MTLPPGLHANVSFDDYLRDRLCPTPSLSSSTVRTALSQSPLHAKMHHPRYGDAHEESSRADLGTAAHAALLGGDERIVVLDADDWRTKAAKDARFAARRTGKIAILRDTSEALPAMVESARRTLAAAGINLDACRCEHTAVWCENGQWCRARPDIVAPVDYAIDYKTATNADPATWMPRGTGRNHEYRPSATRRIPPWHHRPRPARSRQPDPVRHGVGGLSRRGDA